MNCKCGEDHSAAPFTLAIGEHERGGWCWAIYWTEGLHPNSNPHANYPARADGSKNNYAIDHGRTSTERGARKAAEEAAKRNRRIQVGTTTEVWQA